ncbi:MAG: ferredoxin:protochlorophyllide reductase (ATP-dependent) subunit B [Sphingomonadaceae bacterium]|nr:ferredoxin:protochlorophyllide reductase (ATP-dependent) subunit B [Sphingomonadaceae bacterium]
MQLAAWTYEGPPHVGAMRVATAMKGVHYVLHAPQGDTYADLLFTMIERRDHRPPVTYTTFQARDLGTDTAELFQSALRNAYERHRPQAMIVGASCTAELIQDDPAGLAEAAGLPVPVIPLELPSYSRKEHWGAAETFYALVRRLADRDARPASREGRKPRANLLGPTALGFRHRDDVAEVSRLLAAMGIEVACVAPLGASPADLAQLGAADVNIVLYPETGETAAAWLERQFRTPTVRIVPIGIGATREWLAEVAAKAGVDVPEDIGSGRLPWWSCSVDSTYLTGKRVFVFGDASHAVAAARIAADELGFLVCGLGCYNREGARDVRAAAATYGLEPLITDDYLEVEAAIAAATPELILGTQMERMIGKRLGIPAAVISAPVHVQDFPARHSPQMGFEGANVIFDSWVHPLTMGLEEHLLAMFRDDPEFGDAPSHTKTQSRFSAKPEVGRATVPAPAEAVEGAAAAAPVFAEATVAVPGAHVPLPQAGEGGGAPAKPSGSSVWTPDAECELRKIPFFVRGKARRNTERFAAEHGRTRIDLATLYDAKAHYAR